MSRISDWLNRNSLYIALLTAWVAMCGSLYFSEVKGYVPCVLCWYQRILMYPLTIVIAIGLLRRDRHLPYIVLPFSVFGFFVSTYHYLLEKTDLFNSATVCKQGVSCTTQWINWYGFVTIPFLALTAFLIITLMSAIALVNGEPEEVDEEGDPLRMPWAPVSGVIVVVLAVFAALFIAGKPDPAVAAANPFPTVAVTPGMQMSAGVAADPVVVERGKLLFYETCSTCHGLDLRGVANLGNPLVGTEFINGKTDQELFDMIRKGRDLSDPANTTGLVMPPNGGRPNLSDPDLRAVIAYIRSQSQPTQP